MLIHRKTLAKKHLIYMIVLIKEKVLYFATLFSIAEEYRIILNFFSNSASFINFKAIEVE